MTLDLHAIVARETAVRDAAADALRSRRRDAAEAVALMAEERRALDALALVAEVERLRRSLADASAVRPAQPDALDLDAIAARVSLPTCSQCGAVDPPTEPAESLLGERFARHVDCPRRDPLFASNVAVHGLTRAEQREVVDALRKARDESAAAEPVFPAPPRRDVTVARVEHRTAAPLAIEVDRDHCPRCGALDLDHTVEECARRWAEQHSGAAAGIVGAERAPRGET